MENPQEAARGVNRCRYPALWLVLVVGVLLLVWPAVLFGETWRANLEQANEAKASNDFQPKTASLQAPSFYQRMGLQPARTDDGARGVYRVFGTVKYSGTQTASLNERSEKYFRAGAARQLHISMRCLWLTGWGAWLDLEGFSQDQSDIDRCCRSGCSPDQ